MDLHEFLNRWGWLAIAAFSWGVVGAGILGIRRGFGRDVDLYAAGVFAVAAFFAIAFIATAEQAAIEAERWDYTFTSILRPLYASGDKNVIVATLAFITGAVLVLFHFIDKNFG